MTEPLGITFVLGHAGIYGGVRVVACLGERLRRRGHRIAIVSTPLPRPNWRTHLRRLMGRWPAPPSDVRQSFFDGLDLEHRVLERPRRVDPSDVPDADVIIATWWETAEWVAAMPAAKGAKVHFIQQFDANVGAPADRVEATWNLPMRKIVCSRWLADLANDRYGDPDAVVVPNGVDPDLFHAQPRGKQAHPTIGLMYSTHPNKGCRESLEAIAMVRRRIPDLRVVAFGVEDPPRHLPLPGYASYTRLPPQTTLRDLYARCDVWLCASHSEGFHLPPHEAMACRCPVVSTRVGGPMDMVADGVNGYLVDTGEEHALVDRLLRVLCLDEPGWRAMSDAAVRTAMEYSWDTSAERFEAALRRSVQ